MGLCRPRCREGEAHGLEVLLAKSPLMAPSWGLVLLPGGYRPSRTPLFRSSGLRRHRHFLCCLYSLLAEGYLSLPEKG